MHASDDTQGHQRHNNTSSSSSSSSSEQRVAQAQQQQRQQQQQRRREQPCQEARHGPEPSEARRHQARRHDRAVANLIYEKKHISN